MSRFLHGGVPCQRNLLTIGVLTPFALYTVTDDTFVFVWGKGGEARAKGVLRLSFLALQLGMEVGSTEEESAAFSLTYTSLGSFGFGIGFEYGVLYNVNPVYACMYSTATRFKIPPIPTKRKKEKKKTKKSKAN